MDNFDEESLNNLINNSKRIATNKLNSYKINSIDDLKSHSDLLCMVLEYSPRLNSNFPNKSMLPIKLCNRNFNKKDRASC